MKVRALAIICFLIVPHAFAADAKWQATTPAVAKDLDVWKQAVERLKTEGYLYSAVAGANHLVSLFQDVSSKELAYRTVIESIDQGYPVPVRDIFVPGDLEIPASDDPEDYQFYNSYYLYKAILSQERKVEHWAKVYFDKVDRERFPKFFFYQAVMAYQKGDLVEALNQLNRALGQKLADQPKSLVVRMTRMMARIHFERGEYEKALEIYRDFLLKLNPMHPNDWLETGWAYFHLKKYPEAVGVLFNLESKSAGKELNLEKFNLRALAYRATCSTPQMDELIQDFENQFKTVLEGIKRGEPYERFPQLATLDLPENAEFNQVRQVVAGLESEQKAIEKWTGPEGDLVRYIVKTELAIQQRRYKALFKDALNRIAGQVLLVSEQMKFLKFDIERSKYNPRLVFRTITEETPRANIAEGLSPNEFEVRWLQFGDFWRDERTQLKALLVDRCGE